MPRKKKILGACLGECIHVAGIMSFLQVANRNDYETKFIGVASSIDRILDGIRKYDPEIIAISYRLSPETAEKWLDRLSKALKKNDLTDGRTFSSDDVGDGIQGSYYASPLSYNAGIQCVPDVPFSGDYKIDMQDSYGDGWNGAYISVVIDGVETKVTLDDGDSGSQTVNVPAETETLEFIFNSGDWDSEVTFQIYTPSGNLGIDAGPNPVVGVFGLNLCNE